MVSDGVVDAVDVARGREAADVADVVVALADEVEVGVEQLLVLDALDDAEHAPGQVVVDARDLAGAPDEADDRERVVGLDVQDVAAVGLGRAEALLGGQHVGAGQVQAKLLGDELCGVRPARARGDGAADAVEQLAQLALGEAVRVVMEGSVRDHDP